MDKKNDIELNEYFDAEIYASEQGKVRIDVYAAIHDEREHEVYQEYGHADDVEEVGDVAKELIADARATLDDFAEVINVIDLHLKTVCDGDANLDYYLKAPGGHQIHIFGPLEYRGVETQIVAKFELYRGRGKYSPRVKSFYTANPSVENTPSRVSESAVKTAIEDLEDAWEAQVDKIHAGETDADKIEEQLEDLK